LTGITHNFVGALLTRFFLGFIEAAFLPGALFLLSKWYTKKEIALRYTILYSVRSTHAANHVQALIRFLPI
jgi:MFS family permease